MKQLLNPGSGLMTLILLGTATTVACDSRSGGVAAPGAPAAQQAVQGEAADKTYRVTIVNLTSGQPLSPGVAATHLQDVSVFTVGSVASAGIRAIAEDGDPAPALAELSGAAGVHDVVELSSPIHRIGGPGPSTLSIEISAAASANRLSLAVMLICTNDGFTGLDSIKLPGGFSPETFLAAGYDAGTEANNEQSTQIVDPCFAIGPVGPPVADGNGRVATAGVITHHPNIQGGASLVIGQHGWRDPVARITVQRMK